MQPVLTLYKNGDLEKVLSEAGKLLKKFPNSLTLYNLCGTANAGLKRLDAAIKAFEQAIELKPTHAQAFFNIGTALQLKDNPDDAVKAYERALTIKPDYADAYFQMGNALKSQGKLDKAIGTYKKAVNIKPDFADAYYRIGELLYERGNPKDALENFKKVVSIDRDNLLANSFIGGILKSQNDYEMAINFYDKAGDNFSLGQAIECCYLSEDYGSFNKRMETYANRTPNDIRVAALSAFASNQLQQEDIYPFCHDPLKYIHYGSIKKHMPDHDEFSKNLIEEMNYQKAEWEPKDNTTHGGFQTASTIFDNPSGRLLDLKEIVIKELHSYYETYKNLNQNIIKNWPNETNLAAWYVRLKQGGHQASHIHASGWISGVIYLKTIPNPIDNEGAIKFGLHGYGLPIINKNYPTKIYQPKNGDLILFPSSLFHETIPVRQEIERCVIAFDLLGPRD